MKILLSILGIAGFFALVIWGLRSWANYQAKDNARDTTEKAANAQAKAKDAQAGAAYPSIIIPQASWVRMNGALLDLNFLGGTVPPLYTMPTLSALAPNG